MDEAFPREAFEALGYNVAVHGQKTFNGVALLSKLPFDEVAPGLIGDDGDEQARFLEAVVSTKTGVLRVRQPLSAQWQPAGYAINIPTNSNGWTGLLLFHVNG